MELAYKQYPQDNITNNEEENKLEDKIENDVKVNELEDEIENDNESNELEDEMMKVIKRETRQAKDLQ